MGDAVKGRLSCRPSRRPARGSSFVEVLLAMTIMALVLVGILQMFSVSLVINKGSAARTQMLFRCQQVVENIRYFYFLNRNATATPALLTDTAARVRVADDGARDAADSPERRRADVPALRRDGRDVALLGPDRGQRHGAGERPVQDLVHDPEGRGPEHAGS